MKYVLTAAIATLATFATTIPALAQTVTCKYPWDINSADRYCDETAAALIPGGWEPTDDLRSRDDLTLQQALGWEMAEIIMDNGGNLTPAVRWVGETKGLSYFNLYQGQILGFAKCTLAIYGKEETLRVYSYNSVCADYIDWLTGS